MLCINFLMCRELNNFHVGVNNKKSSVMPASQPKTQFIINQQITKNSAGWSDKVQLSKNIFYLALVRKAKLVKSENKCGIRKTIISEKKTKKEDLD